MKVYGLLGEKLGHSLSPTIHQTLFEKAAIIATYGLFEVPKDKVGDVIASIKCLGIRGLNVTIPYKEEIMSQLDELSQEAEKIGAVNTVYFDGEKTIGYNTDYAGFGKTLEYGDVTVKDNTFYVLGAGGAAKSIVWYLKDHGAKVILVTRDIENASVKFQREAIEIISYEVLDTITSAYGIINTTPCGMYPNIETTPVSIEVLEKFEIAIDIVYNPEETLFLQQAKQLGLKTVGGLWMLIGQAVESERLWQNRDFDTCYEEEIYNKLRGDK